MSISIRLHNTGVISAKDVYVVVQLDPKYETHELYAGEDWQRSSNPRGQVAFRAKRSFHPGEVSDLFSAAFQRHFPNQTVESSNDMRIIPHFDELGFRFLLYAENYQGQEVAVNFMPKDLNFELGAVTKEARS